MSTWIKLTKNLSQRPEVLGLAQILGIDRFGIVGRLSDFWSWLDSNSTNGSVPYAGQTQIDDLVATPGFSQALEKVGWLNVTPTGISVPRWDRHNSQSAKARALEAEAKNLRRKTTTKKDLSGDSSGDCPVNVGHVSDKRSAKLSDQRREEKSTIKRESNAGASELALQADAIAAVYPRHDDPLTVRNAILDELQRGTSAEEIRTGVQRCVAFIRSAPGGAGNRYVPKAATFFGEQQWRSPEAFEQRWQPNPVNGKGSKEIPTLTTEKKGKW